jgi:hypothetical protein
MQYPKKIENLYAEELEGELCVYDSERQKMHALSPTAALVWQQCDGETTPAQMTARLEAELNIKDAEKLVSLSLDRLDKAHLLVAQTGSRPAKRSYTRREVLKMTGVSLALLPVVKSIVLPTPLQAQSCISNCFFTDFLVGFNNCQGLCNEELFSFETLCSVENIDIDGIPGCRCNVFTTDLVESGCADLQPGSIPSPRRSKKK